MSTKVNSNVGIELERKMYWKNKKKYLKPIEKICNFRINDVSFIKSNEVFENFVSNLDQIEKVLKEWNISIEHEISRSIVEISSSKVIMRVHDTITFMLPDGSHIRFAPYSKGIEITRLYIYKKNIRKGLGTFLMNTLFAAIQMTNNNEIPQIMAEIVGAVGYGATFVRTEIENQLKFFQNFNFTVKISRNNYMQLIRPAGIGVSGNLSDENQNLKSDGMAEQMELDSLVESAESILSIAC